MINGEAALSARDAERLAVLHTQSMPLSVLGRMGAPTLRRYYHWAAGSEREHVFLAREDGVVTGAAVLSLAPGTVIRRFVGSTPLSFAAAAAAAFLRDSAFRRDVFAWLGGDNGGSEYAPEVMQIFVAREHRSRHTGTALLRRVEEWLQQQAATRYYVRTLADNNQSTLAFYERRGFRQVGVRPFCGVTFFVLEKVVE